MTTYIINKKTTALVSTKQVGYETRIFEADTHYTVTDTSMEIIETICREDWAPYDVKCDNIREKVGYIQKVPIPVKINEGIINMPTHSPNHLDFIWINLNENIKLKRNQNKVHLILQVNQHQAMDLRQYLGHK